MSSSWSTFIKKLCLQIWNRTVDRVFLFWEHVFLTVRHGKRWPFGGGGDITRSTGFVQTVFRKLGLYPSSGVVVVPNKKLISVTEQRDTRETRNMRRSLINNRIFSYTGWLNWSMCCIEKDISRSDKGWYTHTRLVHRFGSQLYEGSLHIESNSIVTSWKGLICCVVINECYCNRGI